MATPLYLGVWNCLTPISDEEAAHQYQLLKDVGSERRFDDKVYAFYSRLISLYPEIDTLSEEERDDSPWAGSIEVSDSHVIMGIVPEQSEKVVPQVLRSPKRMGWYVSIPRPARFTCLPTWRRNKATLPPRGSGAAYDPSPIGVSHSQFPTACAHSAAADGFR